MRASIISSRSRLVFKVTTVASLSAKSSPGPPKKTRQTRLKFLTYRSKSNENHGTEKKKFILTSKFCAIADMRRYFSVSSLIEDYPKN